MISGDFPSVPFSGCSAVASICGASKLILVNNSASKEAFEVI